MCGEIAFLMTKCYVKKSLNLEIDKELIFLMLPAFSGSNTVKKVSNYDHKTENGIYVNCPHVKTSS